MLPAVSRTTPSLVSNIATYMDHVDLYIDYKIEEVKGKSYQIEVRS